MKTNMKSMLALAGLLALGTTALVAQPLEGGPQNDNNQNGPPMRGRRPPAPAIVRALDANHDGIIESNEIANASAELKTLDKNGDGKLTPDEFMGPRPFRRGGPGRGPAGNPGMDENALPPGGHNGAPPDDGTPAAPSSRRRIRFCLSEQEAAD
jgi:EF hand